MKNLSYQCSCILWFFKIRGCVTIPNIFLGTCPHLLKWCDLSWNWTVRRFLERERPCVRNWHVSPICPNDKLKLHFFDISVSEDFIATYPASSRSNPVYSNKTIRPLLTGFELVLSEIWKRIFRGHHKRWLAPRSKITGEYLYLITRYTEL